MITAFTSGAEDFSNLGLGVLTPSECTVTEEAAGRYELMLVQGITDEARDTLITEFGIIRAPAPVRENPDVEAQSGTITRTLYKTNYSTKLYVSPGGKALKSLRKGTVFCVTSSTGQYSCGFLTEGGDKGYIETSRLNFYKTETETISGDTPGGVVRPVQSREQLFRVKEIDRSSAERTVTAYCQHITYDLAGYMVAGELELKDVPAATALARVIAALDRQLDPVWNIVCTSTANITADYGGENLLNVLLDPDKGIAHLAGLHVFRDNYSIYLLEEKTRTIAPPLRYGKNLLKAVLKYDYGDVVTRILPTGLKKNGKVLYGSTVTSSREADYNVSRTTRIDYDVQVGEDGISSEAAALEKLEELAQKEFSENGADLPVVKLDAEFVRLELMPRYRELAGQYALHMYDEVPVIDDEAGITATVRMTGYVWDVCAEKYESTKLGDLTSVSGATYGFDLANGSVSGTKLAAGSVGGDRLRNLSIGYAKIQAATVEQLCADSITANNAYLGTVAAGTVTADELVAALATITALYAQNINAGNIQTDVLGAQLARIGVLTAGSAEYDKATVKHLIASLLNVEDMVGGKVAISNLSVDYASMVTAYVGNLCVKGKDGKFYRLSVDSEGGVHPELVTVTDEEAAAGQTEAGQPIIESQMTVSDLTATSLKAVEALITKLNAVTVDADTLIARQAFIDKLKTVNITADGSLLTQLTTADEVKRYMTFDTETGLTQRTPGSVYYTRVDSNGFYVMSDSEVNAIAEMNAVNGIKARRLTLGSVRCKSTSKGGWVWQSTEEV